MVKEKWKNPYISASKNIKDNSTKLIQNFSMRTKQNHEWKCKDYEK